MPYTTLPVAIVLEPFIMPRMKRTSSLALLSILACSFSASSASAQARVELRATAHLPAPPPLPPAPSVTIDVRPPAPHQEIVGLAPSPQHVWVDGYWAWQGGQHVGIRGRWLAPPAPGHVWLRAGWARQGGHYVFVPGRWAPRGARHKVRFLHPHKRVRIKRGAKYAFVGPGGKHKIKFKSNGRGQIKFKAKRGPRVHGKHKIKVHRGNAKFRGKRGKKGRR